MTADSNTRGESLRHDKAFLLRNVVCSSVQLQKKHRSCYVICYQPKRPCSVRQEPHTTSYSVQDTPGGTAPPTGAEDTPGVALPPTGAQDTRTPEPCDSTVVDIAFTSFAKLPNEFHSNIGLQYAEKHFIFYIRFLTLPC